MAGWLALRSAPTRRLLFVADSLAAVVVCLAAVLSLPERRGSGTLAVAATLVVVSGSTVAWRRLAPFTATILALAAAGGAQRLTHQPLLDVQPYAVILDSYVAAIGCFAQRRFRRLALLVTLSLGALASLVWMSSPSSVGLFVKAALPVTIAPVAAGAIVSWSRGLTRRLELTRALLVDEHELRVARAATDERNRLARELHDVVAHAVSVMVIQAGAARLLLPGDRSAAQTRLERIATAGRDALADLRRLAQPTDERAERGDGLGRLADLAERISQAGVTTELAGLDATGILSREIEQIVYRVAQEALTNVVKHAGGGSAMVTFRAADGWAELDIVNRPPPEAVTATSPDSGGLGLVGMAERVRQHGGDLRVSRTTTGEFAVIARLPLQPLAGMESAPSGWRVSAPYRAWHAAAQWRPLLFATAVLIGLELDVAFSAARRGSIAENALVVGAMALATGWRRSHALPACLAITVLAVPLSGGLADITRATIVSTFVFVVPVYSLATWTAIRPALVGLLAVEMTTVGVGAWHAVSASEIADNCALTLGLWVVGRLVRTQRERAAELRTAAAALVAERAARERANAQRERDDLVRDLEASVLGAVTSMVELAATMLDRPGAITLDAITSIETTGRAALTSMRRILGALRPARIGSGELEQVSA